MQSFFLSLVTSIVHHIEEIDEHQRIFFMAPTRKRTKTSQPPAEESASPLLKDNRTLWLVKGDDDLVEIKTEGETLKVSKAILCQQSEYFETCLNKNYAESEKGVVQFEDIDSKYLALYIGVCYSFATLVSHAPPPYAKSPELKAPKTPLKDFVEVYKLCDRFLSAKMAEYMIKCIDKGIVDGHRALFRTSGDKAMQTTLMRYFADAYEALDLRHNKQVEMGARMIKYFSEGVSFTAWVDHVDDLKDRPGFIACVSRAFATKLGEVQVSRKTLKRKELPDP